MFLLSLMRDMQAHSSIGKCGHTNVFQIYAIMSFCDVVIMICTCNFTSYLGEISVTQAQILTAEARNELVKKLRHFPPRQLLDSITAQPLMMWCVCSWLSHHDFIFSTGCVQG